MSVHPEKLHHLIDGARDLDPVRVAVVDEAQPVVLETLRDAMLLGPAEPRLVGDPDAIPGLCRDLDWPVDPEWIISTTSDTEAAARAVSMMRRGEADVLMKGKPAHRCTDAFSAGQRNRLAHGRSQVQPCLSG